MSEPWKRNLAVPFFSQRENETEWIYKAPTDNHEYLKDEPNANGEIIGTKKTALKKGTILKEVPMADNSCNVSCIAMMLNFLGVTKDSPDDMMEKIYANATEATVDNIEAVANVDRYLRYSKNVYVRPPKLAEEGKPADLGEDLELCRYRCVYDITILEKIAREIYDVRAAYTTGYNVSKRLTLDDVKKEIAAGFPVMVSCGIVRPSREVEGNVDWQYSGHYIVIRGFTNDGVIINDPWGKATDDDGNIPVDAEGKDIWAEYPTHQANDESDARDEGALNRDMIRKNDKNNGENIVIPIEDFKRQMIPDGGSHKFYSALTLYDRRWSFPFPDDDYKLDWVVEGEGDNAKFVPTEESKERHYALESPVVHFPLTNTGTPHFGIHLTTGTEIQSIGSGQVIAAKLAEGADEDIPNGSNCMLLVRHQIRRADTATYSGLVKVFFVLYMHLDPISAEISATISDDSSTDKTPYSFVNEMLEKRNHRDGAIIRERLDALAAGQVVILNDIPNLFLELREGDFIGHIGLKGFYVADARRVLHLEIFSSTNIVDGIADFKTELDITGLANPLDREEVFKAVKEPLFCDYKENLCYYDYDGISPIEIEGFFRHAGSHITRGITLVAKGVADVATDFFEYVGNSIGISTGAGEDTEEFVKCNITPYSWRTAEITKALDGFTEGAAGYYYHPIHFLHWLMTNDEELYAQICPNTEGDEVVAAIKDALEATLARTAAAARYQVVP